MSAANKSLISYLLHLGKSNLIVLGNFSMISTKSEALQLEHAVFTTFTQLLRE